MSGGAPLSAYIKDALSVCFSVPVFEAYATTETAGSLCITNYWEREAGVVGGPMSCMKIRLNDLTELGYLSTNEPYPQGEVVLKGNNVFKGYFKDPVLTDQAFD